MNKIVVSGLTIVLILAAGAMAYGLAAEIIPISAENQIQMRHIPNSYDGRLGYVSILNSAMPSMQGADLDIVLPPLPLEIESAIEEVSAVTQMKTSSQTQLFLNHSQNCRVK